MRLCDAACPGHLSRRAASSSLFCDLGIVFLSRLRLAHARCASRERQSAPLPLLLSNSWVNELHVHEAYPRTTLGANRAPLVRSRHSSSLSLGICGGVHLLYPPFATLPLHLLDELLDFAGAIAEKSGADRGHGTQGGFRKTLRRLSPSRSARWRLPVDTALV